MLMNVLVTAGQNVLPLVAGSYYTHIGGVSSHVKPANGSRSELESVIIHSRQPSSLLSHLIQLPKITYDHRVLTASFAHLCRLIPRLLSWVIRRAIRNLIQHPLTGVHLMEFLLHITCRRVDQEARRTCGGCCSVPVDVCDGFMEMRSVQLGTNVSEMSVGQSDMIYAVANMCSHTIKLQKLGW